MVVLHIIFVSVKVFVQNSYKTVLDKVVITTAES